MPIEMTNAEKEWDKAMNSQRSIISDLFFGQLRSTITCSFCKQASTTYETFNSLTMSLSQSSRCTLNVSILQFCETIAVIGASGTISVPMRLKSRSKKFLCDSR